MISKGLSKCLVKVVSRKSWGSSLVVQCLRLHASMARSDSLIPGRGTKIRTSEKKKENPEISLADPSPSFSFVMISNACPSGLFVCLSLWKFRSHLTFRRPLLTKKDKCLWFQKTISCPNKQNILGRSHSLWVHGEHQHCFSFFVSYGVLFWTVLCLHR